MSLSNPDPDEGRIFVRWNFTFPRFQLFFFLFPLSLSFFFLSCCRWRSFKNRSIEKDTTTRICWDSDGEARLGMGIREKKLRKVIPEMPLQIRVRACLLFLSARTTVRFFLSLSLFLSLTFYNQLVRGGGGSTKEAADKMERKRKAKHSGSFEKRSVFPAVLYSHDTLYASVYKIHKGPRSWSCANGEGLPRNWSSSKHRGRQLFILVIAGE